MVTGLGRDAREEDVRLFLQGGGAGGRLGVLRVSVRDDGDFLHPADRHLVSASAAAAAGQNRLAFVTLRDDAALAAALARDGAEVSPGRRVAVRAVRAQEAGRQAADGPKSNVEDVVRVGRLRVAHRAAGERLQRQLQALEGAAKAAVDAAEAAMADCDVEAARDSLARAEAAIGELPPGDELGVSQVALERQLALLKRRTDTMDARWKKSVETAKAHAGERRRTAAARLVKTLLDRGEPAARAYAAGEAVSRAMEEEDNRRAEVAAVAHEAERSGLLAERAQLLRGDLSGRLAHVAVLVRSAYPTLSYHLLESRLAQVELLSERAEASLDSTRVASACVGELGSCGGSGLALCGFCLGEAKRLLALPVAHEDVRRLFGAGAERRQFLERVLGRGPIKVGDLQTAYAALGAQLNVSPLERELVRRSGILVRRITRLWALYLDAEAPVRARVSELCAAAAEGLRKGGDAASEERGVAKALQALRSAEMLQARELNLDRRLGEVQLLRKEADLRSIPMVSSRLEELEAAAEQCDVFLSFDCGPQVWETGADLAVGLAGAIRTAFVRRSLVRVQQAREAFLAMGRSRSWLESRGWRVAADESGVSAADTRRAGQSTGVRLTLVTSAGSDEIKTALPTILAQTCLQQHTKDAAAVAASIKAVSNNGCVKDAAHTGIPGLMDTISNREVSEVLPTEVLPKKKPLDAKLMAAAACHPPSPACFEVLNVSPANAGGTAQLVHAEVRIKPFFSDGLLLSSDRIAEEVYRGVSNGTAALEIYSGVSDCSAAAGMSLNLVECYWPFPVAPATSVRGVHVVSTKIERACVVVALVTREYLELCETKGSKAHVEMLLAAASRPPNRIIAALLDDVGPPPVWDGRAGELFSSCSWVDCSGESFDRGMENLERLLHVQALASRAQRDTYRQEATEKEKALRDPEHL